MNLTVLPERKTCVNGNVFGTAGTNGCEARIKKLKHHITEVVTVNSSLGLVQLVHLQVEIGLCIESYFLF